MEIQLPQMNCIKSASLIMLFIVFTIQMKVGICWLFPVESNTRSHLNYYYVIIDIGTPSQKLSLLIDTSCSHTYLNPPDPYHPSNYEYESNHSNTFKWLTCMDAENCNVCFSNSAQCGWEFACEQMYVMAKDVINLNDGNDNVEPNYLVFGYNIDESKKPPDKRSQIFSIDDANNDHFIMSGILSLNRKNTSFIQQMYKHLKMPKIFGHYFNRDNGYIAFGNDVNNLLNKLNIGNEEVSWIEYATDNSESSMYQIHLDEITLSSNLELYDKEYMVFNSWNNKNNNLNILTFDTGITGLQMNHKWKYNVLNYIINVSNIELVGNIYYEYCINTDSNDILEDIFDKLPNIKIKLLSNFIYIISPQQYIVNINNNSIPYQFCLDISFDEENGICLGSQSMENYVILYDDDNEKVGIYDKNINHKHILNNNVNGLDINLSEKIEKDEEYIVILSLSLVGMLVCSLLIFVACIIVSRKMGQTSNSECNNVATEWNGRRNSVTMDGKISAQHIDIEQSNKKNLELDSNINSNASSDISISMSSSLSPLQQSYYDGNVKSIVYDRVIRPWDLQQELKAI